MSNKVASGTSFLYSFGFFARTFKGSRSYFRLGKANHKSLVLQILFTFVEALSIASLLALGIGAAVIVIGNTMLENFSQERLVYPLLITIITRELGPLLAAFIIIARSATAIATEIAGMVVSHEVEAYISVGVDPIDHLAVPRFLGVTISLFLLNIYFSIFGLAGSFLVAQFFYNFPAGVYFSNLLAALSFPDIILSVIKSIIFGMIISIVAVTNGFAVDRSTTEIPVAGLKSVGSSFGICIVVDILMSGLYYLAIA